MIPTNWREHRRDDGELIGYVAARGDAYAAHTLFGYPLADDLDEAEAELALESAGLRYLADRWLLTIDGCDDPISVEIVEASPSVVTVQNIDLGYDEADWGTRFRLDVPVDPRRLRPARAISV